MEQRFLGPLAVSPIGMGCMGLSHGYGEIPDRAYAVAAIRKAHDFGCTFFDTAEAYGPRLLPEFRGHNERILGEAVAPFRDAVVLATKLHLHDDEVGLPLYPTIRAHLEASLRRLGTDRADLYYLHRVNRRIPLEDVAEAMGRLIREGLIRGWGLSQVSAEQIRAAHAVTPLAAVQSIYSMVERGVEAEVIPCCLENGIGFVPFSPIASGLLSGKVGEGADFSHADDVRKYVPQLRPENLGANRPVVELLVGLAARKGATPAQIALAWMLRKWPNVVPIPGSKRQERILENLGAWDVAFDDAEFAALERALDAIPIHGHRGFVEAEGSSIQDWGKEKA